MAFNGSNSDPYSVLSGAANAKPPPAPGELADAISAQYKGKHGVKPEGAGLKALGDALSQMLGSGGNPYMAGIEQMQPMQQMQQRAPMQQLQAGQPQAGPQQQRQAALMQALQQMQQQPRGFN